MPPQISANDARDDHRQLVGESNSGAASLSPPVLSTAVLAECSSRQSAVSRPARCAENGAAEALNDGSSGLETRSRRYPASLDLAEALSVTASAAARARGYEKQRVIQRQFCDVS